MPPTRIDIDASDQLSTRAEEVLHEAGRLFLEKGYSATTMKHIADAVGILPGSLYHHFAAKDAIAIALLDAYHRDLSEIAVYARTGEHAALAPTDRVRDLITRVTECNFTHCAAVRLRAFNAPSVASEELRKAISRRPTALLRAWHADMQALQSIPHNPSIDFGLLGFTLQSLSVEAALHPVGAGTSSREVSGQLFDTLTRGLVIECPSDEALDASAPMAAARAATADWKPVISSGDETRDSIIAAARAEFASRGYEATTIRDISAAVGVRMGTLYRRISSKENIMAEIVDNYSEQLDRAVSAVFDAAVDDEVEVLDALGYVIITATRTFKEEARILRLVTFRPGSRPAPFDEYSAGTARRLGQVRALLESGAARGRLDLGELSPKATGLLVRNIIWIPYHQYNRYGVARTQRFLRDSLMRGTLSV